MADELLTLVGPDLHGDVARCAAAAGYRILTAHPADCRREWLRAAAVVADADAVRLLAGQSPPRRTGVVLVTDDDPPSDIWRTAMAFGAEQVVALPTDESALVGLLGGFRSPRGHPGGAIAVVGGHGGAGATTLAAAVAITAGDVASRVLLLDVDEHGAGIDLTLGIEGRPGLRWQDLTLEGGAVRAESLHSALPHVDDRLSVLAPRRDGRRPISADAVIAALDAGRAHGDTVIIDVPRAAGALTDIVLDTVDLAVLLTTATVHGVASTRAAAERIHRRGVVAGLAVRGPAPSGLRAVDIAAAVDLPLITTYRSDPGLPARLEAGRLRVTPRSPLGRAAQAIRRRAAADDRLAA